ncbi:MAG: GatB/YqeY domain-containing protein [Candidatus Pacebacteria bacterium]|nr:GatB/YqeY domain-containing protein [Candidatus Paceibacterota bacterium]
MTREAKRRKDSITQFTDGGRPDLAIDEQAELDILNAYLPKMMPREEVYAYVQAKIAELGITDKSQVGQLMGALMKELQGKADGLLVKEIVAELLG